LGISSEQDAKPAAWLRLTHYKDFAIIDMKVYSASRWSSYTLFVRTSHLDSVSGTGVVNTPERFAINAEQLRLVG